MQGAQLRDDEEQKDHAKSAGVQEVLPPLPLPHGTQRKQIISDFSILDSDG